MLCVACCLLFVVWCWSGVVHCVLFGVSGSFIVRCLVYVVCCSVFVAFCLLFGVRCCLLFGVWCLWFPVRCLLCVDCCVKRVGCRVVCWLLLSGYCSMFVAC